MKIYPGEEFFKTGRRVLFLLTILLLARGIHGFCNRRAAETAEKRCAAAIINDDVSETLAQANKLSKIGRYPMKNKKHIDDFLALAYEFCDAYRQNPKLAERVERRGDWRVFDAWRAYRKGDRSTAFENYCLFLKETRERLGQFESVAFQEFVRAGVLWEGDPILEGRAPFSSFPSFMTFMEEEYERLGRPGSCEVEMNLYRVVAQSKIQSGSSAPDR